MGVWEIKDDYDKTVYSSNEANLTYTFPKNESRWPTYYEVIYTDNNGCTASSEVYLEGNTVEYNFDVTEACALNSVYENFYVFDELKLVGISSIQGSSLAQAASYMVINKEGCESENNIEFRYDFTNAFIASNSRMNGNLGQYSNKRVGEELVKDTRSMVFSVRDPGDVNWSYMFDMFFTTNSENNTGFLSLHCIASHLSSSSFEQDDYYDYHPFYMALGGDTSNVYSRGGCNFSNFPLNAMNHISMKYESPTHSVSNTRNSTYGLPPLVYGRSMSFEFGVDGVDIYEVKTGNKINDYPLSFKIELGDYYI